MFPHPNGLRRKGGNGTDISLIIYFWTHWHYLRAQGSKLVARVNPRTSFASRRFSASLPEKSRFLAVIIFDRSSLRHTQRLWQSTKDTQSQITLREYSGNNQRTLKDTQKTLAECTHVPRHAFALSFIWVVMKWIKYNTWFVLNSFVFNCHPLVKLLCFANRCHCSITWNLVFIQRKTILVQ